MSSTKSGKGKTPSAPDGTTEPTPLSTTVRPESAHSVPSHPPGEPAQALAPTRKKRRTSKKAQQDSSEGLDQPAARGDDSTTQTAPRVAMEPDSSTDSQTASVGDDPDSNESQTDADLILTPAGSANSHPAGDPTGAAARGAPVSAGAIEFSPSWPLAIVGAAILSQAGGSAAVTPHRVLTAQIVLGKVLAGSDLQVMVFKVPASGKLIDTDPAKADWTFKGAGGFNAGGAIQFDLGGYTGMVKIVVRDGGKSHDFKDDRTGDPVDAPDDTDLAAAYVRVGDSGQVVNVNHATTLLAKMVDKASSPTFTLETANAFILSKLFGDLGHADLSTGAPPMAPGDHIDADTGVDSLATRYGILNAVLYSASAGQTYAAIDTLIDRLADLSDTGTSQQIAQILGEAANLFFNSPLGHNHLVKEILSIRWGITLYDRMPPKFDNGPHVTLTGAENTALTYVAHASDLSLLTYSLSGADQALFSINTDTGDLTLLDAPDFESSHSPTYSTMIVARDAVGNTSTQTVSVVVTNVEEAGSIAAISGSATQGQLLTAGTLTDPDGSISATTYQWTADGSPISGATSSTLTLGQAQVGKVIRVVASYTDGQGSGKTATSTATAAVTDIDDAGSIAAISGSATQGQVLSASLSDPDGSISAITYQWTANGVNISGATSSTLTLGQAQVGKVIRVVASYTDAFGAGKTATSTATAAVVNVNDAPQGTLALSGAAVPGQTLTADVSGITDADGLGTFSYQWRRNDGTDAAPTWTAISAATSSTYVPIGSDLGKKLSVVASYTDGQGTPETVTSAATASVTNRPSFSSIVASDATSPSTQGKAGEAVTITLTASESVTSTQNATFTFQVGSTVSDTFTATLAPVATASSSLVLTGTLPAAGDGSIKLVSISGGIFCAPCHRTVCNSPPIRCPVIVRPPGRIGCGPRPGCCVCPRPSTGGCAAAPGRSRPGLRSSAKRGGWGRSKRRCCPV